MSMGCHGSIWQPGGSHCGFLRGLAAGYGSAGKWSADPNFHLLPPGRWFWMREDMGGLESLELAAWVETRRVIQDGEGFCLSWGIDRRNVEQVAQSHGIPDGFEFHETERQNKWAPLTAEALMIKWCQVTYSFGKFLASNHPNYPNWR